MTVAQIRKMKSRKSVLRTQTNQRIPDRPENFCVAVIPITTGSKTVLGNSEAGALLDNSDEWFDKC